MQWRGFRMSMARAGAALALAAVSSARAATPAAAASGVGWGDLVPRIEIATAALLLTAAGVSLVLRAFTSTRPSGFSIRRHADGFGGASTGWTISHPLAGLLGGFALLVLAAAVAMMPISAKDEAKAPDEGKPAAGHEDKPGGASGAASAASTPAAGESMPRQ